MSAKEVVACSSLGQEIIYKFSPEKVLFKQKMNRIYFQGDYKGKGFLINGTTQSYKAMKQYIT